MKDFSEIKLQIPKMQVLQGAKPEKFSTYRYSKQPSIIEFEAQAKDPAKALHIITQLTIEYWLMSLGGVENNSNDSNFYRDALKIIATGKAEESFMQHKNELKKLYQQSIVGQFQRRFLKSSRDIEVDNVWQVPKEVYLPKGIPTAQRDITQVIAPFWISKDFGVTNRADISKPTNYAWAWVDCHAAPLHRSQYQDNLIKHIALAMQARIESDRLANPTVAAVQGGTLIISGIPSSELLDWIQCPIKPSSVDSATQNKHGDAQRFTTIADIEVLIAIPKPESAPNISTDREVLIPLKPGRHYALTCHNEKVYQGFDKRYAAAHSTRGVDLSIRHLLENTMRWVAKDNNTQQLRLKDASNKLRIKVRSKGRAKTLKKIRSSFWYYFKQACEPKTTPEITNDIMQSQDAFFEACRNLTPSLRANQVNKKVIKDNYNILTQNHNERGIMPSLSTLGRDLQQAKSYNVADEVNSKKIAAADLHSSLDTLDGNEFWVLEPVLRKQYNSTVTVQHQNLAQPAKYIDERDKSDKWSTYLQLYVENIVILMLQLIPDDKDKQAEVWRNIQRFGQNIGGNGFAITAVAVDGIVKEMQYFLQQKEKPSLQAQASFFRVTNNQRSWLMIGDLLNSNLAKQRACVQGILAQHKPIQRNAWSNKNDSEEIYQKLYDIELLPGWSMNKWLQEDSDRPFADKEGSFYCYEVKRLTEGAVKCIYAFDIYNELHILHESMHGHNRDYSHIQLTGGTQVYTAGEMYFRKREDGWYLDTINNASGHFRPAKASVLMPELKCALTQLTGIDVEHAQYCGHSAMYDSIHDAEDKAISHEFAEATFHAITVKG